MKRKISFLAPETDSCQKAWNNGKRMVSKKATLLSTLSRTIYTPHTHTKQHLPLIGKFLKSFKRNLKRIWKLLKPFMREKNLQATVGSTFIHLKIRLSFFFYLDFFFLFANTYIFMYTLVWLLTLLLIEVLGRPFLNVSKTTCGLWTKD